MDVANEQRCDDHRIKNEHMKGAQAIHNANAHKLIFFVDLPEDFE